jgi:hypothetical protein
MNGNNNEEENGAESAEENDEENEPEKVTKKSKGRASKQTYRYASIVGDKRNTK